MTNPRGERAGGQHSMMVHRFFSQKGSVSQRKAWKGWGGNVVTILFQLAKC